MEGFVRKSGYLKGHSGLSALPSMDYPDKPGNDERGEYFIIGIGCMDYSDRPGKYGRWGEQKDYAAS